MFFHLDEPAVLTILFYFIFFKKKGEESFRIKQTSKATHPTVVWNAPLPPHNSPSSSTSRGISLVNQSGAGYSLPLREKNLPFGPCHQALTPSSFSEIPHPNGSSFSGSHFAARRGSTLTLPLPTESA